MLTFTKTFTTPLTVGKQFIGDLIVKFEMKFRSQDRGFHDWDLVDIQLADNLSLFAFAEWTKYHEFDDYLTPFIEAHEEEAKETIDNEEYERDARYADDLQTQKSLTRQFINA